MNKLATINNTDHEIDIKRYKYFLKKSLFVAEVSGVINLVFVSNDEILNLNKEYRNKNKTTDVLTFIIDDTPFTADIIISYDWVLENYKTEKIKKEIYKLIIHSILHLKGIHHTYTKKSLLENREKMRELYVKVIKHIKNKN